MATMTSADAAWLRMDRPTNPMLINAVLWFEQPLDPAAVRERLQERLVDRFPQFSQLPSTTPPKGPRWEPDPHFDLGLHLHHVALPAPRDEAGLRALVSDLIAMPLDRDRPLWSVHLIDGYRGGSVLLVRMHHAIADGILLARVMLTLVDGPPDALSVAPPRRSPIPRPLRDLVSLGRRAAETAAHETLETLAHPRHLEALARTGVQDAGILAKFLAGPADEESALRGDLGVGQRVGWSAPLPLRDVRDLGRAFGATINDVLLAAVTGVLGDHMRAAGDAPDEVHAMVPFNLRAMEDTIPRELGNRFGLLLLGLPVGLESPVERLTEIRRRTTAIKESHEGAIAYGILAAMGATPSAVEARLIDFFTAKATMVITNVPGPRDALTLAGSTLGGVLVWAPSSGTLGMSVSIFSYRGQVTVGFLVNRRLGVDPQALADALPAALTQLRAAVR
ncbi:MAG: wax ester/triacylglycerol synthase family O-acyltransferase [Solirubrobacteraceae bacterium]